MRERTGAEPGCDVEGTSFPVLEPVRDAPAARLGERLRGRHPALVFVLSAVVGWMLLAVAMIGLGLLVTEVLLTLDGVAAGDLDAVEWLVDLRRPFLDDLSVVGSGISGQIGIPAAVALACLVLALQRRWRAAGFLLAAILVEVVTYRTTTWTVERERPDVQRLEGLDPLASFPSGHVAASVAVYGGLALLLSSQVRSRAFTLAIWILVLAVVAFAATSRVYRGMHHPTDVGGGLVMGAGALLVALCAARASGVAARARQGREVAVSS